MEAINGPGKPWVDDVTGAVSRPIRLKSSEQTFSRTEFVSQKTCVTTVVCWSLTDLTNFLRRLSRCERSRLLWRRSSNDIADQSSSCRGALFIAKLPVVRYRANFGRNRTSESKLQTSDEPRQHCSKRSARPESNDGGRYRFSRWGALDGLADQSASYSDSSTSRCCMLRKPTRRLLPSPADSKMTGAEEPMALPRTP